MPYTSQLQYYTNDRYREPSAQHQWSHEIPVSSRDRQPESRNQEEEDEDEDEDEEEEHPVEEDESTDLAIEANADSAISTSATNMSFNFGMQGDIRLMNNNFRFEFPLTSPTVDKKLFLNICGKIWDESRKLNDGGDSN